MVIIIFHVRQLKEIEIELNTTASNTTTDAHKYSLCNVFEHGEIEMINMNIPGMRTRRKKRKNRFSNFLKDLHLKVIDSPNTIEREIKYLESEMDLTYCSSFRTLFRQLK